MKYLVFAAATLIAGSALAGESMATKSFESLDKNADGHISVSESFADKTLSAAFATADANSDGTVSKEEFAKWQSSAKPQSAPVEPGPAK